MNLLRVNNEKRHFILYATHSLLALRAHNTHIITRNILKIFSAKRRREDDYFQLFFYFPFRAVYIYFLVAAPYYLPLHKRFTGPRRVYYTGLFFFRARKYTSIHIQHAEPVPGSLGENFSKGRLLFSSRRCFFNVAKLREYLDSSRSIFSRPMMILEVVSFSGFLKRNTCSLEIYIIYIRFYTSRINTFKILRLPFGAHFHENRQSVDNTLRTLCDVESEMCTERWVRKLLFLYVCLYFIYILSYRFLFRLSVWAHIYIFSRVFFVFYFPLICGQSRYAKC